MFEEYKQKLKRYGKSYHNVSKVTLLFITISIKNEQRNFSIW